MARRALACASLVALVLAGCSGANDSGSGNGDTGGETEVPVGTCHLTMFHESATSNLKTASIDLAASDLSDTRCDLSSSVCVVGTRPASSAADGVTFTFAAPKAGDSQQFSLATSPRLEIVQLDGSTTDSWASLSGRVYFTEVSATTGTTFHLVEIGMNVESISGNGAMGTFQVDMQCRGLTITGI